MTNLNDYFSEETVEIMLSNIEVIVGDFECMDDVVLPENMDTIIHAGARTDHFGDDDEFEKVMFKVLLMSYVWHNNIMQG